jgi:hypothetical protein
MLDKNLDNKEKLKIVSVCCCWVKINLLKICKSFVKLFKFSTIFSFVGSLFYIPNFFTDNSVRRRIKLTDIHAILMH